MGPGGLDTQTYIRAYADHMLSLSLSSPLSLLSLSPMSLSPMSLSPLSLSPLSLSPLSLTHTLLIDG
jgi:hypothetical protein